MTSLENFLSQYTDKEKAILHHLASFPDFFSIDWFSKYRPSEMMSLVLALEKQGWIVPHQEEKGFYSWSSQFPRREVIQLIPPEKMTEYYRESLEVLLKNVPLQDDNVVMIANQCILAGVRESDLEIVFQAALYQEKNGKIPASVVLYDALLEYFENLFSKEKAVPSDAILQIFIKVIERRAALSLFQPHLKKITRFLFQAMEVAHGIGNLKAEASLELLIGQNLWFLFQYKKAIEHFHRGWKIISELDDENLQKRAAKVQGLVYSIEGRLHEAIESYEKYLGNIESEEADDFTLLIGLNLALCYTQVGMPQRGLGICDNIQRQCAKNNNWIMAAFSYATTAQILLELKQLPSSRNYFEKASKISQNEKVLIIEIITGYGLATIDYMEGNLEEAVRHYSVIWKMRKSSWFYTLNLYHVFEIGYLLHVKGVCPIELEPTFEYLRNLNKEDLNPLMYGIIHRLQITLLEKDATLEDKIKKLDVLEKTVKQMGDTFELAKIRTEIARLYIETGNLPMAESYARKVWNFLKPIAKESFPADLMHLIPSDQLAKDDDLFRLVLEMGEALTNQENIEQLLTNIITSISRMTGSERTALFINEEGAVSPRMIASRNLLREEVLDKKFQKTFLAIQSAANSSAGDIIQFEMAGTDSRDVRKVIITPLKLGKKIVGVLYQDSRFFSINISSDKIVILSALASQIAVSIDRARAYDEISRLNQKLIQENLYHVETESRPFGEIIGSGKMISEVKRLILQVAPTQSTVLVYGETGVGKELVARAIHRASRRSQSPFIRVNCAALPDSLIDSELFGHEKGAFTGAVKTKAGRFELAHQGTLFLDEISELPLSTQSRLLRVLQEKEFQRVGGTKTLHSDFRLIAATNQNLEKKVEEGKFREDLFYRLNVFPIHVPPLRERREDIPALALHFYRMFCTQNNKPALGISNAEMEKLQNHNWPGNIRELSNMIERAVISGEEKIRFPELANIEINHHSAMHNDHAQTNNKAQIIEALRKTRGKVGGVSGAAALLNLKRTTLIHRMKKYGIKIDNQKLIQDNT